MHVPTLDRMMGNKYKSTHLLQSYSHTLSLSFTQKIAYIFTIFFTPSSDLLALHGVKRTGATPDSMNWLVPIVSNAEEITISPKALTSQRADGQALVLTTQQDFRRAYSRS